MGPGPGRATLSICSLRLGLQPLSSLHSRVSPLGEETAWDPVVKSLTFEWEKRDSRQHGIPISLFVCLFIVYLL